MRSLCWICGCDGPVEGHVRNKETGKELLLCVSHMVTYLRYPMIERVRGSGDKDWNQEWEWVSSGNIHES